MFRFSLVFERGLRIVLMTPREKISSATFSIFCQSSWSDALLKLAFRFSYLLWFSELLFSQLCFLPSKQVRTTTLLLQSFDSLRQVRRAVGTTVSAISASSDVYNVSSDDKQRASLLSWAGPETYALLHNLFGDENSSWNRCRSSLTSFLFISWRWCMFKLPVMHFTTAQCNMVSPTPNGLPLFEERQETAGALARVSDVITLATSMNRFELGFFSVLFQP